MARPKYTPGRLLALAVILLGTLALMGYIILTNQRRSRAERAAPPAQQNARPESLPRE